ncbi:9288_t:CDS:2 [Ambispora leptoticha]|uniref:9288_t:CDS:1 n=1 Tax=Ambispora leptoticha TaxID=144679 RepID=A0A9N9BS04_9GLOM|nr:9288_t:CDS:2 [Ambispora leptoticha]
METNSVFQLLPTEIRPGIFKNLNRASLFNCLLVDRQWCRDIVPILWEEPLPLKKKGLPIASNCLFLERQLLSADTVAKIIDVYVSLFSKEFWQPLLKNEISLPLTTRTPTFNYASYLKHYEPYAVSLAAGAWLKQKTIPLTDKQLQQRNALTSALCKLFLTEAKSLISFYCYLNRDADIFSSISRGCQPSLIFNNLKELRIFGIQDGNELQKFFENFTNICHSIRGITFGRGPIFYSNNKIIEFSDDDKVKNAMMTQNELEWLELYWLSATAIRSIIRGLQSSSRTFRAIRFCRIDFNIFQPDSIIEGLSSCVNLDFHECNAIEQKSWIETGKYFTKLECLMIEGHFQRTPITFIKQIIKTSGDNLQYLLIKETCLRAASEGHTMLAEQLLPFILMYVKNLRTLSLGELKLEQLSSIHESCPKLENIDFYFKRLRNYWEPISVPDYLRSKLKNYEIIKIHDVIGIYPKYFR